MALQGHKALKKITLWDKVHRNLAGHPLHRPDKDTNEDGEWDREYRTMTDTFGLAEEDKNKEEN